MGHELQAGFIGTGTITEAIIEGLIAARHPVARFLVSERGRATSQRLRARHGQVAVFADNQAIIDGADVVVLAVRPQVAWTVLSGLRFAPGKPVLSLIAALPIARLQDWIGREVPITRAIPLPFVAEGKGVTAIYPHSALAHDLFAAMGAVVTADDAPEFDAYAVASALMGTYFGILHAASGWMQSQGIAEADARTYLATLFAGLAQTTTGTDATLDALRLAHSTAGGVNEQLYAVFAAEGGLEALRHALDSVLARVKAGLDQPEAG